MRILVVFCLPVIFYCVKAFVQLCLGDEIAFLGQQIDGFVVLNHLESWIDDPHLAVVLNWLGLNDKDFITLPWRLFRSRSARSPGWGQAALSFELNLFFQQALAPQSAVYHERADQDEEHNESSD